MHSASALNAGGRHFGHDVSRLCAVVAAGKHAALKRNSLGQKISKLHLGIHNKYLVPAYFGDVRAMIESIPNSFTFQVWRVL